MEALQLLKFTLKKQRLNFIDGWATPEVAMVEELKAGSDLGSLLTGDSDGAMDKILTHFGTYD